MDTLSVVGLGKLGSAMLASFAHKGWGVIGVDINQDFVDKINAGQAPVYEPQVTELLQKNIDHIEATKDLRYAILNSSATFIIVPTPSLDSGRFSIEYVEKVIRDMVPAIRAKEGYHLVVITSTVLPGDSVHLRELLETLSGKTSGVDFGFCYNPDFIALGKIVHDFLNPDMILIGQDDENAGEILEKIHLSIVDNKPTVHRMSLYNAELAKIGLNSYCTTKITYANVIAEICENMPTGDASVVLNAIGADSRVGNKYFRGGLGFSGPCFPRDNRALINVAGHMGVYHLLCDRVDEVNDYHKTSRLSNLFLDILHKKNIESIAILGISYKEETPVIEESTSIAVAKRLAKEEIVVTMYDPQAMPNARLEFTNTENVWFADSIEACLKDQTVCFIATPWSQFRLITADQLKQWMKSDPLILDAWNILPDMDGIDVRRIGKNHR